MSEIIGINLRFAEIRERHNLTKSQMAEKLGVHRSNYHNFENGRINPTLRWILKLDELFDVDMNWLIKGKRLK